jgi:hypothetical protein
MIKTSAINLSHARRSPGTLRFMSSLWSSKIGAWLGFVVAVVAIFVGWVGRHEWGLDAGEGLGYQLGIAGGLAMLLLLLYSVRKRFRFTRNLGASKYWFRAHMALGVIGPILILYHCNFKIGSLNSQVALYCTLLVAASGLVGRYLYAQIHNGLYGRKTSLRELSSQLSQTSTPLQSANGFGDDIRMQLAAFADEALQPSNSVWEGVAKSIAIGWGTRMAFLQLTWQLRRQLIARSLVSTAVREHRGEFERTARRFLRQRLREIRRVAQFSAYERLFFLWHVVHVPFFFMMVLSAVVHVLAVHMY